MPLAEACHVAVQRHPAGRPPRLRLVSLRHGAAFELDLTELVSRGAGRAGIAWRRAWPGRQAGRRPGCGRGGQGAAPCQAGWHASTWTGARRRSQLAACGGFRHTPGLAARQRPLLCPAFAAAGRRAGELRGSPGAVPSRPGACVDRLRGGRAGGADARAGRALRPRPLHPCVVWCVCVCVEEGGRPWREQRSAQHRVHPCTRAPRIFACGAWAGHAAGMLATAPVGALARQAPLSRITHLYLQRISCCWPAGSGWSRASLLWGLSARVLPVVHTRPPLPPAVPAAPADVPEGKGVSSSAAVEVATMAALAAALSIPMDGRTLALLCQRVENSVVGELTWHGRTGCEGGEGGGRAPRRTKPAREPLPARLRRREPPQQTRGRGCASSAQGPPESHATQGLSQVASCTHTRPALLQQFPGPPQATLGPPTPPPAHRPSRRPLRCHGSDDRRPGPGGATAGAALPAGRGAGRGRHPAAPAVLGRGLGCAGQGRRRLLCTGRTCCQHACLVWESTPGGHAMCRQGGHATCRAEQAGGQ